MRLARVLPLLERRFPALARPLKKAFVEHAVPMNRVLGLRVERVADDSSEVVLSLPSRRRNRNVGGTVHGAAIVALAETVHGVAVLWQLDPGRHTMVTRDLRAEFVSPACGALTAAFSLEPAVGERIRRELGSCGTSDVELASEVVDASGRVVARLVARYAIRQRPPAGDRQGSDRQGPGAAQRSDRTTPRRPRDLAGVVTRARHPRNFTPEPSAPARRTLKEDTPCVDSFSSPCSFPPCSPRP